MSLPKLDKYKNYIFTDIGSQNKGENIEVIDNASLNKNFNRLDITKSLKMFKYKTRFTLDYANIDYGYNSVRGSTGLVNILFSDTELCVNESGLGFLIGTKLMKLGFWG